MKSSRDRILEIGIEFGSWESNSGKVGIELDGWEATELFVVFCLALLY